MEWLILINGDDNYLEQLNKFFEYIKNFNDFQIYRDFDKYYLKGNLFNEINDVKELIEKANFILTSLVIFIKPKREIELIKIEEIKKWLSKENEDYEIYNNKGELISNRKWNDYSYTCNVSLKTKIMLSARATRNDTGEINYYHGDIDSINFVLEKLIEKGEEDEYLQLINYFKKNLTLIKNLSSLANKTEIKGIVSEYNSINTDIMNLKWVKLYNIYEIILEATELDILKKGQKDTKNKKKKKNNQKEVHKYWKENRYLNEKELDLFKNNVDFHRHPRSIINMLRVSLGFEIIRKPPEPEISFEEAESIIIKLIINWIKDKL